MADTGKQRRAYHAPAREAAAQRTRDAILASAKRHFERAGWASTTVSAVARDADVSPKTVEAIFGRKAELLAAAIDFSIRGDSGSTPVRRREIVADMEAAAASTMLDLHAAQVRGINERSARLAWAVEQASTSDAAVARVWEQMVANRRYGVRWATRTFLRKGGEEASSARRREIERVFWVATDWGTYRNLLDNAGLAPRSFENWLRSYYRNMLNA